MSTPASHRERGSRDRLLLYAAVFLRAVATAMVGVLLGLYLARLGLGAATIGNIAAAGLSGAALAAFAVTLWADRLGRRRTLIAISLLSAAGAAAMLAVGGPLAIAIAAFVGMVNAMGRDRGGLSILEQAMLPETTGDEHRTTAFAWYNALQDSGHALGSLLAGLPAVLTGAGWSEPTADRATLALYPLLVLLTVGLYLRLSPAVEAPPVAGGRRRLTPAGRRFVTRISALFALDGIGGGLLVTTLLSYFLFERFGVGAGAIAVLFAAARAANVVSHFAAARLARRFGLVNTMVFTHIPSSLLLVAFAFASSFQVAAVLFLLRELLVEMDVPTRQSYVMATVAPAERTAASGITNLVRLATWALGPLIAGLTMERVGLMAPLVLAATIKIVYDLLLYAAFRRLPPPEERASR